MYIVRGRMEDRNLTNHTPSSRGDTGRLGVDQALQSKLKDIKSLPPIPSKRWQWRGWHIAKDGPTLRHGWNDWAIYFGNKPGAFFIGFHFPLHTGWCTQTGLERGYGWRIKGGWEYYKPAILTGRLFTDKSKWHMLPTYYIPAKLVHLWRMRRKSYRHAMGNDLVKKGRK